VYIFGFEFFATRVLLRFGLRFARLPFVTLTVPNASLGVTFTVLNASLRMFVCGFAATGREQKSLELQDMLQGAMQHVAGMYDLNLVYPQLESAWFQPLNLKRDKNWLVSKPCFHIQLVPLTTWSDS
jgi:hypothetical protein